MLVKESKESKTERAPEDSLVSLHLLCKPGAKVLIPGKTFMCAVLCWRLSGLRYLPPHEFPVSTIAR